VDVCESYGVPAVFVVSRAVVGTNLADIAGDALASFGIPVLDARTSQRVAYTRALGQGVGVMQLSGAGKASAEIDALASEILSHVHDHRDE
jgi:chromosome partitioning protein